MIANNNVTDVNNVNHDNFYAVISLKQRNGDKMFLFPFFLTFIRRNGYSIF
jgi:hypothetical protein